MERQERSVLESSDCVDVASEKLLSPLVTKMKCPNCGAKFIDGECKNSNCSDPWDDEAIESMDKAIESARTKPSTPWKRVKIDKMGP